MINILSDLDFEYPIGTILRLVHSVDKDKAKTGCRAIVVDGVKLFPNLYNDLIANISHEDLEHFIAVIWDQNDPNYFGAENGFYMKHRFDIHEDQTDFRKEQVKNIKNNDGRDNCFKCGEPIKKVMGFNSFYTICPKCKI